MGGMPQYGQPPQQMLIGQPMRPQMAPPPPGINSPMTPPLRLSIPPQPPLSQPRTPTSATGSQQASPALTPRSESGDNDFMDSSSSRGQTPAPGDGSFDNSGPTTPTAEGYFGNGEPPQKVIKRRPSAQQQKRRQSAGGKDLGGPQAKKRARKGSKVDGESDYDSYMDNVMVQLKNLPPLITVEPKLSHYYNACPIYGSGDLPKMLSSQFNTTTGLLEGSYGKAGLSSEGDYYSTMPFGPEPPVPNIQTVTITSRGFYSQEFENSKPEQKKPADQQMSPSPDLFYSSSPEPDIPNGPDVIGFMNCHNNNESSGENHEKKNNINIAKWHDLEPDDSDDEELAENQNSEKCETDEKETPPPKIIERPHSPFADLVVPIPIKPKPAQMVTLRDLIDMDKENKFEDAVARAKAKSVLPLKTNGSSNGFTSITMTLGGSGSAKSVLKALNGLAKILKIEAPKQWLTEDKNGIRDSFRVKEDNGKDGEPIDLQVILSSDAKICRHCDVVLKSSTMVVYKSAELPFLSKQEREELSEEIYFCDEHCYFEFAMSRTNQDRSTDGQNFANLEQLKEWQEKQQAGIKIEQAEEAEASKVTENDPFKHRGKLYKHYNPAMASGDAATKKRYKKLNENDLTAMMFQMGVTMMPPRDTEDTRECLFCHMKGDGPADGPARLLNYDVNKWVHLNCALWSEEVYETQNGALVNVETALKAGVNLHCKVCEKNGATVKCFKVRCTNFYHVGCANKDRAVFFKNKSVYCHQHVPKGEKDQELTTLAVYRRVYIDRDEDRQVAKVMTHGIDTQILRVGSLLFLSVGQILPHQLHNFHTRDYIFPIGYKIVRYYWSLSELNKRRPYTCSIAEVNNKPEFHISTIALDKDGKEIERNFKGETARGVWMQVLSIIEKMRRENDLVKVFPAYISGEDLFGLNETNVIKVLESLPGIESLTDYNFKYGRNPLLELPLAVNPTGCARSEPLMRTRVKRIHNFQRSMTGTTTTTTTAEKKPGNGNGLSRAAKESVPLLIGLETTGPYSKNFVQSKSSQYRKMKQEWRQNVVLARSGIQGLGLYAARDIEKHQMVIEYIGEVIRSDLTDIREKHYTEQNRGIYMFRLDDDRVLDATMSGNMARYINHSCNPNCVTEVVEVDRDLHIIIFANRRINRGEELSYDYKFDYEDDNRLPCLCGAHNCKKWMN